MKPRNLIETEGSQSIPLLATEIMNKIKTKQKNATNKIDFVQTTISYDIIYYY